MSKHYPEAKMLWNEIKRLKKIDEINEKITIQLASP
jgi:tRNA-dihydrouridine synthase C